MRGFSASVCSCPRSSPPAPGAIFAQGKVLFSGEGEEDWAMGRKQKRPTADFFEELAHLLRARLFAAVALAFFYLGRHPEPDFKASLFQFPLT